MSKLWKPPAFLAIRNHLLDGLAALLTDRGLRLRAPSGHGRYIPGRGRLREPALAFGPFRRELHSGAAITPDVALDGAIGLAGE